MGLKVAKLQAIINKAMTKQLGDVSETVTYISLQSDYDAITSETVETRTETECSGAVFYDDKKNLALLSRLAARGTVDTIESELPALKVLIPGVQLAAVTPKVNDVIVRGETEYTIENASIDPVGAVWVLTLRRP